MPRKEVPPGQELSRVEEENLEEEEVEEEKKAEEEEEEEPEEEDKDEEFAYEEEFLRRVTDTKDDNMRELSAARVPETNAPMQVL